MWPIQYRAWSTRAVNRVCTEAKKRESLLDKQDSVLLMTFSCSETQAQLTNHPVCKQRLESSKFLWPNYTLWKSTSRQKGMAIQSFSTSEVMPSGFCKPGARGLGSSIPEGVKQKLWEKPMGQSQPRTEELSITPEMGRLGWRMAEVIRDNMPEP